MSEALQHELERETNDFRKLQRGTIYLRTEQDRFDAPGLSPQEERERNGEASMIK